MVLEKRAKELFESGKIENLEIGTFQGLSDIHQFLFQDIYDFAGKIREVNIAKGNFQFAPRIFLAQTLEYIDKLPQETFDEIIDKYSDMNVAHPFREGNGQATRIWLDLIREPLLPLSDSVGRSGSQELMRVIITRAITKLKQKIYKHDLKKQTAQYKT